MDTSPPPIEFEDRKNGLVIFGVLTMLIGGLFALFVPLMLLAKAAQPAGSLGSNQSMAPAVMMYGLMSVVFIWLGIGSTLARRWARALLLILSWTSMIVGVVSIAAMGMMMPHMIEAMNSAGQSGSAGGPDVSSIGSAIFVVVLIISAIIFVAIPGAWVLFYRSKHVKATCEAHDPVVRWTDRSPLPVIAVSIWLAFSAAMMLVMPFTYHGVIAFFGAFAVGWEGSLVYIVLAAVWGYCAWAMYKLDLRGWWATVVTLILFSVSSVITYSRHDIFELYKLMGYPEEQLQQLEGLLGFLHGRTMAWGSVIGVLPFLCYLVYIRKFFTAASRAAEPLP